MKKSQIARDCYISKDGYLKASPIQRVHNLFNYPGGEDDRFNGCFFMTTWEKASETYIIWATPTGVYFVKWSQIENTGYEPEIMRFSNGSPVIFQNKDIDVVKGWDNIFFINATNGTVVSHCIIYFDGNSATFDINDKGVSALYGCSFEERLVLANGGIEWLGGEKRDYDHNTIFWSQTAKFDEFPLVDGEYYCWQAIEPYDGDTIRRLITYLNSIFAIKQNHIYRVTGLTNDNSASDVQCVSSKYGSPTGQCAIWNNNLYFIDRLGHLCVTGGGSEDVQIVSAGIEPTIKTFSFPSSGGLHSKIWANPWEDDWGIYGFAEVNENYNISLEKDEKVETYTTTGSNPDYSAQEYFGFENLADESFYINQVRMKVYNSSPAPRVLQAKLVEATKEEIQYTSWDYLEGSVSNQVTVGNYPSGVEISFDFNTPFLMHEGMTYWVFVKVFDGLTIQIYYYRHEAAGEPERLYFCFWYGSKWMRFMVSGHETELEYLIIKGYKYQAHGHIGLKDDYTPSLLAKWDKVTLDIDRPSFETQSGEEVYCNYSVEIHLYPVSGNPITIYKENQNVIQLPFNDSYTRIDIYKIKLDSDDEYSLVVPELKGVTLTWYDADYHRPIYLLPATNSLNVIAQETTSEEHKLLRWDGANWTTKDLAVGDYKFIGAASSWKSYIFMANSLSGESISRFHFFSDNEDDPTPVLNVGTATEPDPYYKSKRIIVGSLSGVTDLIRWLILSNVGSFKLTIITDRNTSGLTYTINRANETVNSDLTQKIIGLPMLYGRWLEFRIERLEDTTATNWKFLPLTIYHAPKFIGYDTESDLDTSD